MKIGGVVELLDISVSSIRLWEKLRIIKPRKMQMMYNGVGLKIPLADTLTIWKKEVKRDAT